MTSKTTRYSRHHTTLLKLRGTSIAQIKNDHRNNGLFLNLKKLIFAIDFVIYMGYNNAAHIRWANFQRKKTMENKLSIAFEIEEPESGIILGIVACDYSLRSEKSTFCPKCGKKAFTYAPCDERNVRVFDPYGKLIKRNKQLSLVLALRAGKLLAKEEVSNPTVCGCHEIAVFGDDDDPQLALFVKVRK